MPVFTVTANQTISQTYTVSALNKACRLLLEQHYQRIRVEGEISNLSAPSSGHLYFKLKDDKAHIQCAFFRNRSRALNFELENGMHVVATATVSLYEVRGDYQLIVEAIELAGVGALQQKFELLKQTLAARGLFDQAIKKPLPYLPSKIGIITSATGAAIHDILTTLKRRFPAIPIALYPTEVQGEKAAAQIARQIQRANAEATCDVLIVARGGGSLEDLWSFNEEIVAYAIYESRLPIISGIGHETDVTIADLCADWRAATPTAAAEAATPNQMDVINHLALIEKQLKSHLRYVLNTYHQKLHHLSKRLITPVALIQKRRVQLNALSDKLHHLMRHALHAHQVTVARYHQRLLRHSPIARIHQQQHRLKRLEKSLHQLTQKQLHLYQQRFKTLCATLHATSPLATLDRGYSLVFDEQKKLITDSNQVAIKETVWITLKKGQLHCQLIDKKP